MKLKVFAVGLIILAGAALILYSRRNPLQVSCQQNTNPSASNLPDKPDAKKALIKFYEQCLKPQYAQGFAQGSKNYNSESQAYALLQSFWAGDSKTFAEVLAWTESNLARPNDHLLSWQFDVGTDGHTRVLDQNSATDADTDYAYALLLAGSNWHNDDYIKEGTDVAADIWDKETGEAAGKRLVIAGNWANQPDQLVVDPSYFSPQAYRLFAQYDKGHDWSKLITDGYNLLTQVSEHGSSQPFVPPNWVAVRKIDGTILPYADKPQSQDFGYDAFRVFWRVAFDFQNSPSDAAKLYLSSAGSFASDWQSRGQTCALYLYQNGNNTCDHSTTSTLAAPIGIFAINNPTLANQVVNKYYFVGDTLKFPDTDFYAQSWHWFAMWLWINS
ncbi:MAG TPA: glycosyl hydrolase family 8 [Patescibacteria group bacterium]|nr:glycosyl hydrolase family 8 [Patescibacteria group bacterium]